MAFSILGQLYFCKRGASVLLTPCKRVESEPMYQIIRKVSVQSVDFTKRDSSLAVELLVVGEACDKFTLFLHLRTTLGAY